MTRPAATGPTKREADVLRSIKRHLRAWRCAPTRREIGVELGISRPSVEAHLQGLRAKGVLVLTKQWRGIFVVKALDNAQS